MDEDGYIGDYKQPTWAGWLGLALMGVAVIAAMHFFGLKDSYKFSKQLIGWAGIAFIWGTCASLFVYVNKLESNLRDCFKRYKAAESQLDYYREKCGELQRLR